MRDAARLTLPILNVDIEPTNRCNARCFFCPRDQTPHEGVMSLEVFEQVLARIVEFRESARRLFDAPFKVNLCGLGEPLINKNCAEMVRRIRGADLECSLTTNASLLDEEQGRALLDAGLQGAEINISDEGEDYDRIYGIPFARTRDNALRFAELARDRCRVRIVVVDHQRDPERVGLVMDRWRERGIDDFLPFEVMNRGGALFVDHMQYQRFPERSEARELLERRGLAPLCAAPFLLLFVGYDGRYYLCCSDWKKQAPLGSVFDESFSSVVAKKLEHVATRRPVCETCNLDPVNRLVGELRASGQGQVEEVLEEIASGDRMARGVLEKLGVSPEPDLVG